MINNDKIFSSESYNFDNEQSQEGIGSVIVGIVGLGPFLLFALLLFLANIGVKISDKKDKNKMKKYYERNKDKINEIARKVKNADLLNELKKINLTFRKNPSFIESEYDEMYVKMKDYNTAEISSFSTNEEFIEYLIKNYMFVNEGNIINFKLFCSIVPKNVKSQDLINTSNDINKPCSLYSDNYLKKINNEIDKLCKNSKIQYFEYKSCKISTNPDDWYEEFDNGLPIDVELQYTLDLNNIVKG